MTSRRYPGARREDLTEVLHGRQVADPYRWLESRRSEATRAWERAQHALADTELAAMPETTVFCDLLTRQLPELARPGLPMWVGGRAFHLERREGSVHFALLVTEPGGAVRVVADPAALDPTGTTTLDAFTPSPDGRLVACQASRGGTEDATLTVLDVDTGRLLLGPLHGVRHSPVAWLGTLGFFYVGYDKGIASVRWLEPPSGREATVLRAADRTVRFGLAMWDRQWLVVSARRGAGSPARHWLADLTDASPVRPDFREVRLGDGAAALSVGRDGRLYARSNRDAPRGELLTATGAEATDCHVVLPERPDAILVGVAVFDRESPPQILAVYSREGSCELSVHHALTGKLMRQVPLPSGGSVAALAARDDGHSRCWLSYSDPFTPPRILRLDIRTGTLTSDDKERHRNGTLLRVSYPSVDGTNVTMSLLVPGTGAPQAGPLPALLTAYGGFGYAAESRFHPEAAAWVAAGGIWATACVRGGGERGRDWHEAGRGANKPNAVADLHAAADWLVEHGWTARDRLALLGVSNGGLLTGAALVERPEAYAAVACVSPLLDMVRYEHFGLGSQWRAEYGSTAVREQLGWLLSYSPYHRVECGRRYPPTLLVTMSGDTRVDAMHARKMCAALQHANADGGPVLLHEVGGAGHGAKPASIGARLAAAVLGFLAHHTGLRLTPASVPPE